MPGHSKAGGAVAQRWAHGALALRLCIGTCAASASLCVSGALAQDVLAESPEQSLEPTEPPAATAAEEDAPPPAPTSNDPQLDDRKARELFEQGRAAYDQGEYRDAWDYFHQAYILSKRPQLLYNVGQAADRLRQDREAVAAFRLYLKKLPDAENRREVENRLRALEERVREEEARRALAGEDDDDDDHQAAGSRDLSFYDDDDSTLAPPGAQPKRQGWYMRVALGLGAMRDGISNLDLTLSGATGAGLITLGYGVEDELVVGGGVFFDWVLAPKVADTDIDSANLTLVGPFADYYFDPHGDGWHAMAALGIGALTLSDTSATVGTEAAGGGALLLGGGYEWPYDRTWAMGVLGRLTLARLSQDLGEHTVVSPSVSFTAAWY